MGKRKADDELERFVWKRNILYDIQLLNEIEQFNPYASRNQKPVWDEIAEHLMDHPMAMKVSARSCRERAAELLKNHRQNERSSLQTSGVGNERETLLQQLLTNVSKLEEARPSITVKSLFATNDRAEAESIRNSVLIADSESDKELNTSTEEKSSDDFDFGPENKKRRKNPKSELVTYLEAENKAEMSFRKDELDFRKEELAVKKQEIEVQRLKVEADAQQNKAIIELLAKVVNPEPKK
ncbi:hypothetical protein Bhyg_03079 [Pseudolycoriella hygida]|uniref:Uncharacterized protein n=1 Tax=Pseudolycoriella hygida TaxID=35572 RepID=A0A9Q0NDU5_9DIPT|nr:hypothetical protein Bhyg_03079 [Pseudolycoriella hygida]